MYVSYSAAETHALVKNPQNFCVTNPAFSVFVGHGHLQHAGAEQEGGSFFHCHSYFIPSHVYLKDANLLHVVRLFPLRLVQPIYPNVVIIMML